MAGRCRTIGTALAAHRHALPILITALAVIVASVIGLLSIGSASIPGVALPIPVPPATGSTPIAGSSTAGPATARGTAKPSGCSTSRGRAGGTSTPTRICIPRIAVDASVIKLGLNADRTVQVPRLSQVADAGWYRYSAAPGTVGPTVILGHVDSARYGKGVFFHLSRLHQGDPILVTRGDGRIATYVVVKVVEISKLRFPSQSVYGATSGPAIRLVTCGGPFDAAHGRYLDNIIVYGTMVALNPA